MTTDRAPAAAGTRQDRRLDDVTAAVFAFNLVFAWFLFAQAPLIPRLQDEFGVSRSIASLHSVAMAVGTIVGALVMVPMLRRLRRGGGLVWGGAGLAAGAVAIAVGPWLGAAGLAVSISGYGLAGFAGAAVATAVAAMVDARHGESGGAVLSFFHGTGASAGLVAPLAIGAGIALGLTWRPGFLLVLVFLGVALVLIGRVRHDPALADGPAARVARASRVAGARMPRRFWVVLGVVMAGVALEFFFTVWSGDLVLERTGLSEAGSTAAVSGFIGGMAVARLVAARIAAGRPTAPFMVVGAAVVLAGWSVVWIATLESVGSAAMALAGLVIAGLGIGAFFPLGTMWLVAESGGRPEAGLAWLALGTGVASGAGPFALGTVADAVGVHSAFLLVPAMAAVAVVGLAVLARGSVTP